MWGTEYLICFPRDTQKDLSNSVFYKANTKRIGNNADTICRYERSYIRIDFFYYKDAFW